ncbi:hypothetical protein D3C73_1426580 [compost metagenome]
MPIGRALGGLHQGFQALLGGGIAAHVQAVLRQGVAQRLHLRLRGSHLGAIDLREQLGADIAGQQRDDQQHDQQFQQGKALLQAKTASEGKSLHESTFSD